MRLITSMVLFLAVFFFEGALMAQTEETKIFDLSTISPRGAAYDIDWKGQKVYVPQLANKVVVVLDADLKLLSVWKDIPSPHGVSVAEDGTVYIGTHRSGRIKKFDGEGKEIPDWDSQLVSEERMKAPVAVTVGPDQNLYVCDWILQRVIETSTDGRFIRVFDDSEIKSRNHFQPHGVALDTLNKRIYVADRGSDGGSGVIQVFSMDGGYLGHWPRPTADFDPLSIRSLGEQMYIAPSYSDGGLYIFDDQGGLLEKIDAYGDGPGKFKHATNSVLDDKGFLYVAELDGNRIQKVDFRSIIAAGKTKRDSRKAQ